MFTMEELINNYVEHEKKINISKWLIFYYNTVIVYNCVPFQLGGLWED